MNDVEQRRKVLQLVLLATGPRQTDSQLASILEELERLVPHPDIGHLIFSEDPELSPDEIVERALAYVPRVLPPSLHK